MRWQWLKKIIEFVFMDYKEDPIKTEPSRPVFVFVFDDDARTYKEKWNDVPYLDSVKLLRENKVWKTELLNKISDLRKEEEKAKTQDEWNAKHEAVKAVQALILLPNEAELQIVAIKNMKEAQKMAGETDE